MLSVFIYMEGTFVKNIKDPSRRQGRLRTGLVMIKHHL
jgi:hypothetical protein